MKKQTLNIRVGICPINFAPKILLYDGDFNVINFDISLDEIKKIRNRSNRDNLTDLIKSALIKEFPDNLKIVQDIEQAVDDFYDHTNLIGRLSTIQAIDHATFKPVLGLCVDSKMVCKVSLEFRDGVIEEYGSNITFDIFTELSRLINQEKTNLI